MTNVRRLVVLAVAVGTTSCMAGWKHGSSFSADAAVPDSFVVAFETSRGRFDVMARTQWSPAGVDRFYQLVNVHYYDDARFFRVVKDFVAQFGLPADPSRNKAWRIRRLADEPVRHGNLRGTDIAFISDIPAAAGLSSSSALIVAFFVALEKINQWK